ncbi:MAG: hypothetical protein JSW40_07120 [Candidatus Omnitrophota bacterium]|nr:MAG: hypothetical protein JSW40_07120 [Candidatus Omnitrophota bacterium]
MRLWKVFFVSSIFMMSIFCVRAAEFKELRSEHFIIKYEPGVSESYVKKVKKEAEYFYRKITQEFNLIREKLWMWTNRAKIFIAKDQKSYLEKFGCQSWSTACVNYQTKTIYTFPDQRNFSSVLAHELTHIIFREYIGYSRFPLWLDEGMAMYIQYKGSHEATLMRSLMKKVIKKDKYIRFSKMQTIYQVADKDPEVDLFYQQAFSMVDFLISRFGKFHFKLFLGHIKKGANLEEALRKSFLLVKDIKSFEDLWKRYYLK